MAKLENTTEHHYHFTVNGKTFEVPRGNGESGPNKVNGSLEVTDEELKAIQADTAVAHLIDQGHLAVGKAHHKAAQHEESAHGHAHKK